MSTMDIKLYNVKN